MKIKFLLFAILISSQLFSQKDKPKPEDIAYAEALYKQYDDEDVVIKNKEIKIYFSRNSKTKQVEVQQFKSIQFIAIATRADLGYSSGYDNQSTIKSLKLLNNRNKQVNWYLNDEAYSDESIFHNDYRIKYGAFSLPTRGYTRTIKEEKSFKDIKYYTTEYLIKRYRTIAGKLSIHIPDWLDLEIKEYNFEGFNITKTISNGPNGQVLTYYLKDIPPLAEEEQTPGSSFIYPHIMFLSKSFQTIENKEITLFKNTKDLYQWYTSLVKEVEIDNSVYAGKVAELIEGKDTDEEKIKAIYYWVQDNIKYIAFQDGIAGFKPDSPQNVFDKKYGDCKGMSILLKSMLVEAGFDARLVWIGTNAIAYDYSTPSLSVDNHMITAIVKDGKPIFLDGTEKYNSYGNFASRIQGKQAMVEDGDSFILASVPVAEPVENKEVYQATFKIMDDNLVGQVNKIITGEQASQFLYGYHNTPKDQRNDALNYILKEGNENAKITDIQGFEPTSRDKEIRLNYHLKIEGCVSSFDNEVYLELDPVKYLFNFSIKEDRKNPIEFYNTNVDEKKISLEIPKGYIIKSYPEKISIENSIFSVNAFYTLTTEKLIYQNTITFKKRAIEKDEFELWNNAIDKLKTFYNEQIVLIKN